MIEEADGWGGVCLSAAECMSAWLLWALPQTLHRAVPLKTGGDLRPQTLCAQCPHYIPTLVTLLNITKRCSLIKPLPLRFLNSARIQTVPSLIGRLSAITLSV